MVQKISQLREGNLNFKFGSPVCFLLAAYLSCWPLALFDIPIIRSAGLPATLEEVAGEALLDDSFSAMTEAVLEANSSWSKSHGQFPCRKVLGKSSLR